MSNPCHYGGCLFTRYGPTPPRYVAVLEALDSLYDSECQDHCVEVRTEAQRDLFAAVLAVVAET